LTSTNLNVTITWLIEGAEMSQQLSTPQSTSPAPVSNDARAMMMFEANKKSIIVAYILWFFVGSLGGHRFYMSKVGGAVAQLLMTIFGVLLLFAFGLGVVLLIPVWIWVLVDAFLIPGWIRVQNTMLAAQLSGT
jgi:TM2 domain-containing membrane protein YozV